MHKILAPFFLFFGIASLSLQAQMRNGLFGNEWINYTQSYYKLKVIKDGVYQIPRQTLLNAGVPLNTLAPENLQLFGMGQEKPIHIEMEANGVDIKYIEFYAEKNRGQLDADMYKRAHWHFNPEFSLVTDTAAYFLTWNGQTNNLRYNNIGANLSGLPAPETHCLYTNTVVFNQNYNGGKPLFISGTTLYRAIYESGEGYGKEWMQNQSIPVPTPNLFAAGNNGQALISLNAYSYNQVQSTPQLFVNNSLQWSSNWAGDTVLRLNQPVAASLLQNTTNVQLNGAAGSADIYTIAFVKVEYPRAMNFGGQASFRFKLKANGQRRYLELAGVSNTNANLDQFFMYDLNTNKRYRCFWDAANNKALIDLPAAAQDYELVFANLGNPTALNNVGRIDPVVFADPNANKGDYIIVSHNRLRQPVAGVGDPVIAYAAYRASTGFSPVIFDVEDLYNQFAYGINYHPLALRNMAHFINVNWQTATQKYVFLIGKGLTHNHITYNVGLQNIINANRLVVVPSETIIPTFGYPPSDNVMLGSDTSDAPVIPVGRLAAINPQEVATYLQKIRDLEAQRNLPQTVADRGWLKNVLHLGGGSTGAEQSAIRSSLMSMKGVAEATHWGATVESFFKTSSNPIQAAQSQYLDSLISNVGVSMITFFGHSSANSFDFNLDIPSRYSNYRKYPLIMALGCYGGTIYETDRGVSEQFVHEPTAGAIAFLASVGAGELTALAGYGYNFYQNASLDHYGLGIGRHVQATIRDLQQQPQYYTIPTVAMAGDFMCLHGDPAYNLNISNKPDYYIDNSLVSHSPNLVTIQNPDFELVINPHNLGMAIDTMFWVEVSRTFPNGGGTQIVARQQVIAPYNQSTFNIRIPTGGTNALGANFFTVRIDAGDLNNPTAYGEIQETSENNNIALNYAINIVSAALLPVYPPNFGIVPTQPITLKASTGNTMAALQTYVFEIDTTARFNSPLKQQTRITQTGGLVEWTPTLTYVDSTVYYWRVSYDSISPTAGYMWDTVSFIYMDSTYPGWNQSHFFQFQSQNQKDILSNLVLEEPNRKFEFITSAQEVLVRNGFTQYPLNNELLASYINGSRVDNSKCNCPQENGIFIQVIDHNTFTPWRVTGNQPSYGDVCDLSARDFGLFFFKTNQANTSISQQRQADIVNFLTNTVRDSNYVMLFTLNNSNPSNWSASFKNYLINTVGANPAYIDTIASRPGGLPYILFFQKGIPISNNLHKDTLGMSKDTSVIALSGVVAGDWNQGRLTSTVIGPVQNWQHLYWDVSRVSGSDLFGVDVYGLDAAYNRTLLISNLTARDSSLTNINAQQYPYLQMDWKSFDLVNRTSPHLDYWRIISNELPEAALTPNLFFSIEDTVQRGQPVLVKIAMQNISGVDMDSMLVHYKVASTGSLYTQKLRPLLRNRDTIIAQMSIPTDALFGNHQLLIEINPSLDTNGRREQNERFYFNNIAILPFVVVNDRINPLLDVAFDGQHIMNGDIVSASPEITIQLSDENKYLALNRLEDFSMILRHPSFPRGEMGLDPATVPNLVFTPATTNLSTNNKAKIQMRPNLPADGKYTLYISAKDRSNNNSGDLSYSVDFEVVNKPSISNMLNYPNPFTTSTQFVFTLTGKDLPDYMKIQIFNINGKIVKEIGMEELGTLRIGLNRTEYAWNGTDTYGDRLANGVYFYRVITQKDGQAYDQRIQQRVDQFFQNGFGKMYLMR